MRLTAPARFGGEATVLRLISESRALPCGGAQSVGFGKNKVLSLPDAVSKALAEHYGMRNEAADLKVTQIIPNSSVRCVSATVEGVVVSTHRTQPSTFRNPNSSADICPVCGQSSLIREEGCTHCRSCGYSEC